MPDLEDELDSLYGLPLEEFTGARNDLAARLKRDGDAEGAAMVRALKKPSAPAWVVNQLARYERPLVAALLKAAAELRRVQSHALQGGAADELQEATASERDAVRELLRAAQKYGDPSDPTLERVRKTLAAVAGNEEAQELVERGRLTEELEPAGFPLFAAGPSAPRRSTTQGGRATTAGDELAEARRRRDERREQIRILRARVRDLKRSAAAARREAERAEAAHRQASAAADRARQAAEEASQEALDLGAAVDATEQELEQLEARERSR